MYGSEKVNVTDSHFYSEHKVEEVRRCPSTG